ncbi:hypothetical protein HNP31_003102 [Acinetobacter johnsonii]|nr:hypothetical protein [Acinetobacter johnsonii]
MSGQQPKIQAASVINSCIFGKKLLKSGFLGAYSV